MPEDLYILPAAPGQEWMWLIQNIHRRASPYHIVGLTRVRGPVDLDVLSRCLDVLIQRHEILRTVFRLDSSGQVTQVIRATEPFTLERVDPFGGTETSVDARLARAIAWFGEYGDRPFDLATGPLVRAAVTRIGPDDHVFALVLHHIVSDGWTMNIVLDEVIRIYERLIAGAAPDLPEPDLQYADFAVWHREWLASEDAAEHIEYWRRHLKDVSPLDLPADPPTGGPARETAHPIHLDAARTAALTDVAAAEGGTVFMVLVSALAAVLTRWSGRSDLLLSTPVAGRARPELEEMVGFFVNTLPLRVDTSGDPTLRALIRRLRRICYEAYDHQDVPYETIVRGVASRRRRDRPLCPVMIALRNLPGRGRSGFDGVTMEPIELPPSAGEFDFFIELVEQPDGSLSGHVVGNGGRYGLGTVTLVAEALCAALEVAADKPDVALSELPVGLPAE